MKKSNFKKMKLIAALAIVIGVFLSAGIVHTETPAPEAMRWATPPYTPTRVEVEKIPPIPDPMEWEVEPRMIVHRRYADGRIDCTITMTAAKATPAGGGEVEYYFQCPPGGNMWDRGWSTNREYTRVVYGLMGPYMTFRVKVRDVLFKNETAFSDPPLPMVTEEP